MTSNVYTCLWLPALQSCHKCTNHIKTRNNYTLTSKLFMLTEINILHDVTKPRFCLT